MTVNVDWHLKSLSRKSQKSGRLFTEGQRVISYIYKAANGEIQRADVHVEEANEFTPSGILLGWWEQVMKNYDNEAEAKRQAILSSEELFLSLYEEKENAAEEADVLKYLLALMLERKRILKPIDKVAEGHTQRYLHTRTKKEFSVPFVDIMTKSAQGVMDQLKGVIALT